MDRDRVVVLATVQDRVHQVLRVLKRTRSSLTVIWATMFPLDLAPSSILGLLGRFRDTSIMKELVRHQLVAGVKAAL